MTTEFAVDPDKLPSLPSTSLDVSSGTLSGPLNYKSVSRSRELLRSLWSLQREGVLCDVTLTVGGNPIIHCHRIVLASSSPFFRAMLAGSLAESRQHEIELVGMDTNTLESLISFCYTGELRVSDATVQLLLPAACQLQLSEVQEVCCEFLKSQLDPSNCLGIRAFADTHSCKDLVRSADKYTHQNFQDVVASEEFLQLAFPQLIDIISSEELNVRSEEQVFAAALQWIRYDLARRRPFLSQVLTHVRLPLCHPKFLVSTVSEDVLVKSDPASRDLVDEAKNYLLLPLERAAMQGPRTRPRKPLKYGEVLYAVGGWCSGDALASVEFFSPGRSSPSWKCVAPMNKRRCGVGVVVVNDQMYAVGGHDGQSYLNSVERYDPATNQWSCDVSPTSTSRTSVGVAVLDGLLYAVGGQDGVSCLNIVERYDAVRNEWSRIAPMSSRRLGVSVAVLNGCLYAVGGSDGQNPLNTVERYDPRTNKWQLVRSMYTRRKHLGSAVYGGALYAVGGRDDSCELSSAERYDAAADDWMAVVSMTNRRSGVGLAVVNDRLYAVGGFDGTSYLKSVEVLDADCKQWRLTASMNYRRLGGGYGVVRLPAVDVSSLSTRSSESPAFEDPLGIISSR